MGIELVLFDFGGVLACEGYRNGLEALARENGLEPEDFIRTTDEVILKSGYLTGQATESHFWEGLRERTGIQGSNQALRSLLLEGFVLRDWMMELVRALNRAQVRTAILSDQTNWLDELEHREGFFHHFEAVFNSFHTGKSKLDASLFDDVLARLDVSPRAALFIDDNAGHIARASARGLHTIHYQGKDAFLRHFAAYFPSLT